MISCNHTQATAYIYVSCCSCEQSTATATVSFSQTGSTYVTHNNCGPPPPAIENRAERRGTTERQEYRQPPALRSRCIVPRLPIVRRGTALQHRAQAKKRSRRQAVATFLRSIA